jgi:hypothetical protein
MSYKKTQVPAMKRGVEFEDKKAPELLERLGYKVLNKDPSYKLEYGADFDVVSHPDFLVEDKDGKQLVVEVKTTKNDLTLAQFKKYRDQSRFHSMLSGLDCLILAVQFKEKEVERPNWTTEIVLDKLLYKTKLVKVPTGKDREKLLQKIDDYKEWKNHFKAIELKQYSNLPALINNLEDIKQKIKDIEDKIREELEGDVNEVQVGNLVYKLSVVKPTTVTDTKALEELAKELKLAIPVKDKAGYTKLIKKEIKE